MFEQAVDLDEALPLSLIRQHTKTDDDISVTDVQLKLYRQASIEAAEAYTGRVFSAMRTVSETIEAPWRGGPFQRNKKVTLRNPCADGVITLSGGGLLQPFQIIIGKGESKFKVPFLTHRLDISCCHPCGESASELIATYKTGNSCGVKIPNGVIIGCLKYIAWQIGNPGDELVTMGDKKSQSSSGISGTNNAIYASGASEQWRLYRVK